MRNDQLYIYSLILEKYLQDMEIEVLTYHVMERFKLVEKDEIWPDKITPPLTPLPQNNKCPLCWIDLNTTMCYTCINPKCPTGMGPLMCKA